MTGEIMIRSASEEDFAPLCALYCKSVRCNPQGFIQDLDYHGCLIAKTRAWRRQGGDMLVGYHGGTLIAMGGLAPHEDDSIELCKLHVDAAWQGRGLGQILTERLIATAHAKGFAEIKLHVTTTQTAALGLYRSIGFRPVKQATFKTTVAGTPVAFDTLYMHLPIRSAEAFAPPP
jgi:ribosomal protein S18 acetylase RimI-like enzyme